VSEYDPTLYEGAAQHYWARPPYAASLPGFLSEKLGLDGKGRLLDVGCGPGVLALLLVDRFEEVIGLDPDRGMLVEASRKATERGIANARWVEGRSEEIGTLGEGTFRLVTFGQSFQWTDRALVADLVYDFLEPGGGLALIGHNHTNGTPPAGPGLPMVPHDAIHALIRRYLGEERRAGRGTWAPGFREPAVEERHEAFLARSKFGESETFNLPGRDDLVQDIDQVLASFSSMSFATPGLFGDRRAAFEVDFRDELLALSPTGLFWDWPGDTEVILARRGNGGSSPSA
jgi:SAM-dependent methyltransferase